MTEPFPIRWHAAGEQQAAAPSAPADRAAVLLRRTESYLSALHGSVARHDNLGVNLGCAGCELRDDLRAEVRRMADKAQHPAGTHVYLSTGCHHGDAPFAHGLTGHEYCQSKTGVLGSKTPAQCKGETCGAPCVCACHTAEEADRG